MRNGLTKTLAAVACACLGYQAFALAPVIRAIPSPVVTDDSDPVTGANQFVFKDAFSVNLSGQPGSLNDYVTDDGSLANIIWSYTSASLPGRYKWNGANKLDLTVDSPANPPASKVINSQANITNFNEFNPDNNVLTPTIRDIILTPFNGSGNPVDESAVAAGTVLGSEVVTLFASDGTTQSAGRNLIVWSVKAAASGSSDRLSATPTPAPVRNSTFNFAGSTNGWLTLDAAGAGGTFGPVTYAQTTGICVSITAVGLPNNPPGNIGAAIGGYASPYGATGGIALVNNAVWRVRATMSTTQTTPGLVPLWDILFQNLNTNQSGATLAGDNAYTGDLLFLDNVGSANAIKGPAAGINQFDAWYTPSSVLAPQWANATTGAFAAANSGNKDMRIIFRVLSSGGTGYLGENDSGQICITNMLVDRFDLSRLFSSTDVYNLNPIVNGINGVTVHDVIGSGSGAGSTKDFTTNPLTIAPLDPAGYLTELTTITPGDTIQPALSDPSYGNGSSIIDNYPVIWTANTLYETTVQMSAPTVGDEASPPDAIIIGFDTNTIELFGDSYILSGLDGAGFAPGMPKSTTTVPSGPQSYVQFFWSHNGTASATPEANRLRPKVSIANTTAYNRPGPGNTRNTGAIRINSIKVSKVQFFGM